MKQRSLVTLGLLLLIAIVGYVGYNTYQRDGLGWRNSSKAVEKFEGDIGHTQFHAFIYKNYYPCFQLAIFKAAPVWDGHTRCQQSLPSNKVEMALIGDSKAEELLIGLANAMPTKNIAYYIQNAPPLLGDGNFTQIYREILSDPNIKQVILSADWYRRQDQIPIHSSWSIELEKTVKALKDSGKEVFISDGTPIYSFDPYKCKFQRKFSIGHSKCAITDGEFSRIYDSYASDLQKVALNNNVSLLNTAKTLCALGSCSMVLGDKILYRDAYHLNINGSLFMGSALVERYPNLINH